MYTIPKSLYIPEYQLPLFITFIPPGYQEENQFHNHEFSEIAIVAQGEAIHKAGGKTEKLSAGDVIIMHLKNIHAFNSMVNFSHINIIYDAQKMPIPILDGYDLALFDVIFPRTPAIMKPNPAPIAKLDKKDLQRLIKLIKELSAELQNIRPGRQFFCMGLFMEIITHITRSEIRPTNQHKKLFLVGDAVSYINEHYKENITLSDIARKTRMSSRSLSRHFKNASGMSPVQYIIYTRLNHAAELLVKTNDNIEYISSECGFKESNYFIRAFKKRFKQSPYKFRLSHKE